jgi:hypothetical protein
MTEEIEYQTKDEPFVSLGFTVMPANIEGQSPLYASFTMIGSLLVEEYEVDYNDGSEIETGQFEKSGDLMVATVGHKFTYLKGASKYTAKAFYPKITIRGKSPAGNPLTNVFNTEQKGRCLTILVKTPPVNQD